MTSSARASSDGGTVSPSVVAVWVLTTSSNFIGSCSQQAPHAKSSGFLPDVHHRMTTKRIAVLLPRKAGLGYYYKKLKGVK